MAYINANGMTAADARSALQSRKEDISDVGNQLFFDWCNKINHYLYQNIKGYNPGDYSLTNDYTVSASPSTQSLPSDFRDVSELESGVFRVDSNGNVTDDTLPLTGIGSQQVGYYISGSNIVFTGINNGNTYKLVYFPTLSQVTLTTNTLIIGVEYQDYIVNALDVCYTIWDEDVNAEVSADQRFVRSLAELLDNFRKVPDVYAIEDSMSNF